MGLTPCPLDSISYVNAGHFTHVLDPSLDILPGLNQLINSTEDFFWAVTVLRLVLTLPFLYVAVDHGRSGPSMVFQIYFTDSRNLATVEFNVHVLAVLPDCGVQV